MAQKRPELPDIEAPDIRLPSWMRGREPVTLARAAKRFWIHVAAWAAWPLQQFNALTCNATMLDLLAWERDIVRFDGEPMVLYRKRVAYAFVNARDAGSIAGFAAIFERLGIGYIEQSERVAGLDWDIIIIRVTDNQISSNRDLMADIIRKYGRTCRRYQYEVVTASKITMSTGAYGGDYVTHVARISKGSK